MQKDLCTWVFHHLSEYLDHEMQADVCQQVDDHVRECVSCRALLGNMQNTVDLLHEMAGPHLPEACLNRIREKVLRSREQG